MIEMTTLGGVLLGALLFDRALQTLAEFLNLRGIAQRVPEAFRHEVDDERWERVKQYLGVRTRLAWVRGAVDFGVLLAFWWAGGFGWLDGVVQGLGFGELATGLLYLGALGLGGSLISLPFQWWNDFGVEARFGFHRQTPASWWGDRAKGMLVGLLVGGPLLSVLLLAFGALGDRAWLVAWVVVTLWTVLLQYLAPSWILPLFMKFSPLEDEELRAELDGLAEKTGFPLTEVSVVDASNRSSHANAFFTGFGKRKRIALFDTLLERHSHGEVTAVLAHEIGHWSLGHIWRGSVLSIIQMGGFLALLGWVLGNSAVYAAFGVAEPSVHVGLALFGILTTPLGLLLGPMFTALSRRNEFQADAYAREITGRPEDLVRGLTRLSSESLANLTPHPLYVALNYSHPPLLQRVRALQQG